MGAQPRPRVLKVATLHSRPTLPPSATQAQRLLRQRGARLLALSLARRQRQRQRQPCGAGDDA